MQTRSLGDSEKLLTADIIGIQCWLQNLNKPIQWYSVLPEPKSPHLMLSPVEVFSSVSVYLLVF